MSDDSDNRNKAATSSESSDNARPLVSNKRRRKQLIPSSDDGSSDSDSEEIIAFHGRRPPPQILSDYESGQSSGEGNDSGSSSDSEANQHASTNKVDGSFSDSSDADDQTERCPICLVKFKTQEIGSLETCDHCFCVACIQEWAKNVPTCPVDRQPFSLILVREHLEGKVIRQIPITPPLENSVAEEDATSCEVCGQNDREDRMLLCDWCDHGYHMDCLDPPLEYVPIDEWYCPECSPSLEVAHFATQPDLNVEDNSEEEENVLPYRPARRMVPRTRHSERVRFSLGHTTRQRGNLHLPSQSSGVESMEGDNRPEARRRTRKRTKRKPKFRIKKIVTDDGVIEVILKSKRKAGKKCKRRTVRTTPQSVKGRLASKLGMCAPRVTDQLIPETRSRQMDLASAPINHQRHQAGIPVLDLFGRRDQLEYFSGSDNEDEFGSQEGGLGVISRTRVSRPSDRHLNLKKAASILNSTVQRKPIKSEPLPSSSSANLIDSILDSQTLWHSKSAEIKSKADGSLQVLLQKSSNIIKEEQKIDVKKATASVVQTPMFSGGKPSSATYNPSNSNRGQTHSGGRSGMEQSQEGRNATLTGSGTNNSSGPSPLRSVAPIRFRMNLPPRRPNIHSYPSDNIPPPPPLRLRSPLSDMSFPMTNSPESSPPRDDEEIDIYSDIEQSNTANNEGDEKSFGTLEPPPEPPFLMTMEPPPEPPAMLMTLNDDPSDDEATGLVIADEPADTYDPCAVNSDDSSNEDRPLAKPPELPIGLVNPELVANYSSDSETIASTYNPELPTYQSTPIIGPLPRPPSHNSSEAEDNDEECPNFSMYSAASMSLAHRGKITLAIDLDIPIPPPVKEVNEQIDCNIPLPDSPKSNRDESELDIPIPANYKSKSPDHIEKSSDSSENQKDVGKLTDMDTNDKSEEDMEGNAKDNSRSDSEADDDEDNDDEEDDENDGDDDEGEDPGKENCVNDGNESDGNNSGKGEDKSVKSVVNKAKRLSETADDECSTQGDVLDLAIEPETNLENNIHHDENDEQNKAHLGKELVNDEIDDKNVDGGDKSDGLVDITDEEMSVYDCQENADDLDKLDDPILESASKNQNCDKSLYSDDDNSLVGGATSAVSGGTLNNSDNVHPQTLPGLEGLETETISESEDVNFDELPLEGGEPPEMVVDEEEHSSSRKKKKKKNRKTSHTDDDGGPKGNIEPLEFEEGEIVEDKPKQLPKKDKKVKSKPESNIVKGDENINTTKSSVPEKESTEKRQKKKKDKGTTVKDKSDKHKEIKEKTLKPGQADENISWKKLSKNTKDRNYRDGKEKDEKDKDLENKDNTISKKDKRSREKRKELERYNVRRLISEKPKRPKKDEFGRDISPSKSGSSLSPYRPPRYRSPLRTRNRSRTRSRSWKSRSRSRGRRRRSRSRDRVRSRDRSRKTRSRDRSRRSRSKNKASSRSRERRRTKTPERADRVRNYRSVSKSRRRSRSPSFPSRKYRSYSRSWSPSWSQSSFSRSRTPRARRRSRSNHSRSKSKSWTREQNVTTVRSKRPKDPPKNLTVIVTNKEALKKKEKKKISKKRDDLRKKKHNQSPAPSKEVFTSGDNILVSVNFKNANKTPELIPASTPLLRESSKRKRDEGDTSLSRKKKSTSSKKTPGAKKSNRLSKINEAARNAKPVAIIDLDLSPFREVDLSPKEVIVLSDSGDEGEKKHSEMQDEMGQLGHSGINQSMLTLVSNDHKQKAAMTQPESPLSTNFILNISGPKTPPEPHIKFSISTKPSQVRMLSNPLMEADDELHDDENIEDVNEILHKGPNTPPEPPPDLNTPASPPTTPYDPFDPTKSRSPSPQPRSNDVSSQHNSSREDKLDNISTENEETSHLAEPKTSSPIKEFDDLKKTPEPAKVHSTPKSDPIFPDLSPKTSSPTGGLSDTNKLPEDTLMKPIQKILASASKLDIPVHKSPEKLVTVVINQQQVKSTNQTPKQAVQPLKSITPNKHQTPKGNTKHQLFSSSLLKQVPILGALQLLPAPPLYTNVGLNSTNKISSGRTQQNGEHSDDMDIDPSSPYSPGSSEGDDLFEPPIATPPRTTSKPITKAKPSSSNKFDSLFGTSPAKPRHGRHSSKAVKKGMKPKSKGSKKEEIKVKLDEDQLKILDELPSSAVEMQVKDKFLKKLNRQERVVEEVKLVLKPHYAKKHVTKEEYKEILRRSVPKICHNKSGEINPIKIQFLIEAYVKKFRYAKKKASGSLPALTQNKPKPLKSLWS